VNHLKTALRSLFHTQEFRTRFTRSGLAYSVAMLAVATGAFSSANNLLFLILAAMFSTFLISGFIGKMGLAGLELDVLLPEHISARRKIHAGLRLRNVKLWIPSFSIHVAGAPESGYDGALYFPVVAGRAAVEESVDLYFPRRGTYKERSFQFSTSFPFGFTERRERVTARHEIVVYPCLDPQPGFEALLEGVNGELDAMQRGRGGDFYRIRRYEAMESARHVDWKATAHTGELQVREFAREHDRQVLIYLDLDVPSGLNPQDPDAQNWTQWFESAVECAAFLAFRLAERGARVQFETQEFAVTLPDTGDIYTILKYLAQVSPRKGRALIREDSSSFQIVLSARPELLFGLGGQSSLGSTGTGFGGSGTRVLGPDAFPFSPAQPD
jgi:uncharacterized protein (DUF58 family)